MPRVDPHFDTSIKNQMICKRCEFENPENFKFCQRCGESLVTACSACDVHNDPGANFCSNCGAELVEASASERYTRLKDIQLDTPRGLQKKILAARSQLDGERRPVTILFTDIVGSTAIASNLDPEDWREIVAGAQQCISEAIYRYKAQSHNFLATAFWLSSARQSPMRTTQFALFTLHSRSRKASLNTAKRSSN